MSEQPDFSTNPRPRRPPVRDLVMVAIGLLALAGAVWSAWTARQEADEARALLREMRREIDTMESRLEAFGGRSAAVRTLLARASAATVAPPDRVVKELAGVLPGDARLERLTIAYGDVIGLDMQVVARDANAWDRLLEGLEQSASFEEVVPGPERREGLVRTSVRARWGATP